MRCRSISYRRQGGKRGFDRDLGKLGDSSGYLPSSVEGDVWVRRIELRQGREDKKLLEDDGKKTVPHRSPLLVSVRVVDAPVWSCR